MSTMTAAGSRPDGGAKTNRDPPRSRRRTPPRP